MSSDGVSAVRVIRDDGNVDHLAADAPGSSGDRKAEADGSKIPRLQLYADLTYSSCYIDKSLYARSQLIYQPTRGLVPVQLQDLQLTLQNEDLIKIVAQFCLKL